LALSADRGDKRVRARDIFNDAAVYAVSVDLDAERCSALMFLARARIMAAAGKKRRVSDQGCGRDPRLDRLPQGVHRVRRRWHCGRNAGRSVALAEASRRYQVFMTLKFDKRIS